MVQKKNSEKKPQQQSTSQPQQQTQQQPQHLKTNPNLLLQNVEVPQRSNSTPQVQQENIFSFLTTQNSTPMINNTNPNNFGFPQSPITPNPSPITNVQNNNINNNNQNQNLTNSLFSPPQQNNNSISKDQLLSLYAKPITPQPNNNIMNPKIGRAHV